MPPTTRRTPEQVSGKINNMLSEQGMATILSKIKPLDEMPGASISLLYSDPGVGKTATGAHLARENGLIVTNEPGYETLRQYPEVWSKCKAVWFNADTGVKDMLALQRAIYFRQIPCDLYMIDTLSGIVDRLVTLSIKINDGQLFNRSHPDMAILQDYLWVQNMLRPVILSLADLVSVGCNVVINCHTRYPSEAERAKGDDLNRPDLPNGIYKLANEAAGMVGYLHRNKAGVRLIRTEADSSETNFAAKRRNKNTPNLITPEQFIQMFNPTQN